MNKRNRILIMMVLLIGLSACVNSVPTQSSMEESKIQSSVSDMNNQRTSRSGYEFFLYRRNGDIDTLIGSFSFPEDTSYCHYSNDTIIPRLWTTSPDGRYAFLGIGLNYKDMMPEMYGRPFRLNLDTVELTDYGKNHEIIISNFILKNAIVAGDDLYPKSESKDFEPDGSVIYTYFHSETMEEQTITLYPELEHKYITSVDFRRNPNNGDWYYFFSIPRYGLENPKSNFEAYGDIELYCTVFDSGGNAKFTNATTLDWPISRGHMLDRKGEFIVGDGVIYTSYVSKWTEDFAVEEFSFIEYDPYTNGIREIAAYPPPYFIPDEWYNYLTCFEDGTLTLSLHVGKETWEKHKISVTDGEELMTPITMKRPEFPDCYISDTAYHPERIFVGNTADGGYYYIIGNDNA